MWKILAKLCVDRVGGILLVFLGIFRKVVYAFDESEGKSFRSIHTPGDAAHNCENYVTFFVIVRERPRRKSGGKLARNNNRRRIILSEKWPESEIKLLVGKPGAGREKILPAVWGMRAGGKWLFLKQENI